MPGEKPHATKRQRARTQFHACDGSRLSLADFGSDRHSEITFRTDELTDDGVGVKGNRGQFPRFTAKYCKLPRLAGCGRRLVNSDICLRFRLLATRYVIVLNQPLGVTPRKVR